MTLSNYFIYYKIRTNYHQISIVIFLSPFIIVTLSTEFGTFMTSYIVYCQFHLKHQAFEFLIRLACYHHCTISTFSESSFLSVYCQPINHSFGKLNKSYENQG